MRRRMAGGELGKTRAYRAADWPVQNAKCRPVPLTEVSVRGYLGKRVDRNTASIVLAMESPIPQGFEAAVAGTKHPKYRLAAHSDLYKWLEGACYVFARTKDQSIKKEPGTSLKRLSPTIARRVRRACWMPPVVGQIT